VENGARSHSRNPAGEIPAGTATDRELTGHLATYKTEIPLTLRILESETSTPSSSRQLKMLWNDVEWRDGSLSGAMLGDVGTEETSRRPYAALLAQAAWRTS
jgi:hypothetical protein